MIRLEYISFFLQEVTFYGYRACHVANATHKVPLILTNLPLSWRFPVAHNSAVPFQHMVVALQVSARAYSVAEDEAHGAEAGLSPLNI